MPIFVAPRRLKPFISNELRNGPLKPIRYREGNSIGIGYDAKILRVVCEIWLCGTNLKHTSGLTSGPIGLFRGVMAAGVQTPLFQARAVGNAVRKTAL